MKIGDKLPEFLADAYIDGEIKKISLSDFKGKWIILFFYPADFTFVCPTEIRGFQKKLEDFKKLNAVVFGASTDSVYSHKAWFEKDLKEIKFPILADTSHKISRNFDVLLEEEGMALRGTFIFDTKCILQYQAISNLNVGRSVEEILRVLQALQTGELCPVDWKPGEETIKNK